MSCRCESILYWLNKTIIMNKIKGGEKIKANLSKLFIILSVIFILVNISAISADEMDDNILTSNASQQDQSAGNLITVTPEQDLKQIIVDSNVNDVIILEPGTYTAHNINLTKNITLQGNGDPKEIILDGEKKAIIFLVENQSVHARFNNLTFINGVTKDFGGAISMYSGNVYVDNCYFINNSALKGTCGGAIANYGIDYYHTRPDVYAHLFVNNSFFINNSANMDGGAITTNFAYANIYNSVFMNNTAGRDGGAIRIDREGYADVKDCVFMFNYAKEWGGAYYSWVGESNIERCVFANNTAGTNGGALVASANINVTDSIIVNNTAKKTGGALFIKQPCNKLTAAFIFKNNLITNNTAPLGKEVFVKWKETKLLLPYFDDNDWGDEDPNDPSIIDPNHVIKSSRRTVSTTIKSSLLDDMGMSLMDKYNDLVKGYYQIHPYSNVNKQNNYKGDSDSTTSNKNLIHINSNSSSNMDHIAQTATNSSQTSSSVSNDGSVGDLPSVGTNNNAYELNERNSVVKQISHIEYFLAVAIIAFLALFVGYREKSNE